MAEAEKRNIGVSMIETALARLKLEKMHLDKTDGSIADLAAYLVATEESCISMHLDKWVIVFLDAAETKLRSHRIDALQLAGALIAAEIERLLIEELAGELQKYEPAKQPGTGGN